MKLLIDTHFLIWLALDPDKLRKSEMRLIADETVTIHVSAVSLWELRLKWSSMTIRGDRKGPLAPDRALAFVEGRCWPILPLAATHAVATLDTPLDHSDPFDELLLVQAQVEGLRLLTRDARLRDHPLVLAV